MLKFKKHYHINPVTLAIEEVQTTFRDVMRKVTRTLLLSLVMGVVFFFLFISFFPAPRERVLQERLDALRGENTLLVERLDNMQFVLSDLQQRDDNLYRALLQAEPIPISVRLGSVHSSAYYDSIARLSDSRLMADLVRKADVLENELYVQAKSYRDLAEMVGEQKDKIVHIPSIQPVLNKDLTRLASGYGWRMDPVYHTRRFHQGMDFTAPTGTDIYVTGDGRVSFSGWKQGYGNCVIVDHGYGYASLYAHCHKLLVRQGQQVSRGQVIALVGSTGKSTGPHLHYEVHHNGVPVDPRNFYFQDLSPEDYDRMVQLCDNSGNMLD